MNLPDDLNEWSKESFNMMRQLFQKTCSAKTAEEVRQQEDNLRTKVISKDDLTNLKIDLGRINTVDDFLKGM